MAVIKTKNNSNAVPAATALKQGELAVDVAQGRLWVGEVDDTSITEIVGGAIGGGTDDQTLRWNNGAWESTSDLVVDDAGNVGIGTTSPSTTLTVREQTPDIRILASAADRTSLSFVRSTVSTNNWRLGNEGGTFKLERGDTDSFQFTMYECLSAGRHSWYGDDGVSERMRIDTAGNVGIGTDTPQDKLHVEGNVSANGGFPQFILRDNDSTGTGDARGSLQFRAADDAVSADIGFPQEDARLQIRARDANGTISFNTSGTGSGNERMRITSAGEVLVGTTTQTSPSSAFLVRAVGNTTASFITAQGPSTTVHTAWYNTDGAVLAAKIDRDGLYTNVSDVSLKENIVDSTLGLAEVLQIPVRSFNWKGNPDEPIAAGFIAQELEQALPSAVSTDEKTGLKGRSDGHIVPVLVKAIQEQQSMITELTTRLEALEV